MQLVFPTGSRFAGTRSGASAGMTRLTGRCVEQDQTEPVDVSSAAPEVEVPRLEIQAQQVHPAGDADDVDHDLEPAQRLMGLTDDATRHRRVEHVAGDDRGLHAERLDLGRNRGGRLGSTSAQATFAPTCASRSAVARPIPNPRRPPAPASPATRTRRSSSPSPCPNRRRDPTRVSGRGGRRTRRGWRRPARCSDAAREGHEAVGQVRCDEQVGVAVGRPRRGQQERVVQQVITGPTLRSAGGRPRRSANNGEIDGSRRWSSVRPAGSTRRRTRCPQA